jgi:dipeptidyl-peptidase-4
LYDLEGHLIRQLTVGDWPVAKVNEVDEEGGWVYLEGWTETPLERHLYRVALGGDLEGKSRQDAGGPEEVKPITAELGWRQAVLGLKATHFIDTHSALLSPPQVHVYTVGGERLTTLQANELPERDEYAWIETQFVTLEAADGTPLYGRLTLPLGFAPGRRYPASRSGKLTKPLKHSMIPLSQTAMPGRVKTGWPSRFCRPSSIRRPPGARLCPARA